ADQLNQKFEGERWSILGVLNHVANAEHWYLDRLSLAHTERDQLPSDVFDRLLAVREQLCRVLPTLAGSNLVVGVEGEFWSPRKVLRRAAWHEIDHIEHIFKLMAKL
ncbi:MAG: DinB family protein, partial [Anaerolineaceae bacterium]|nr:DinB family protein [Anaerolineaceae bacterium]